MPQATVPHYRDGPLTVELTPDPSHPHWVRVQWLRQGALTGAWCWAWNDGELLVLPANSNDQGIGRRQDDQPDPAAGWYDPVSGRLAGWEYD